MYRLLILLTLSTPSLAHGGIFTGGNGLCSANAPTYWHRIESTFGLTWRRYVVRWQSNLCGGNYGPLFASVIIPAWERPVVGDLTDPGVCACVAGTDDLGIDVCGDFDDAGLCVVVDSATVGTAVQP